jgi:hypothetical protein
MGNFFMTKDVFAFAWDNNKMVVVVSQVLDLVG